MAIRRIDDIPTLRQQIFDMVRESVANLEPFDLGMTEIAIKNPYYDSKDNDQKTIEYTSQDELNAILKGQTLARNLKATLELRDKNTGQVLDRRTMTLAKVPYLTNNGTFIIDGRKVSLANQLRLRAGIYSRVADNGDIVALANPEGGHGYRLIMDPNTGVIKLFMAGGSIPLLAILRNMGVDDELAKLSLGEGIYRVNAEAANKANLARFESRIPAPGKTLSEKLQNFFSAGKVDPVVMERLLGIKTDRVDGNVLLAAAQKLTRIYRGEIDEDERDSLPFQRVMTPASFIADYIRRNRNLIRSRLWRAGMQRSLAKVPPRVIDQVIYNGFRLSGLGQYLEDINPAEHIDQVHRITRMGEGSISDPERISMEARSVQPTFMGYIDPVHTPENEKIGVDMRLAWGTYVDDRTGVLYREMIDPKTASKTLVPSSELLNYTIAFPGELKSGSKYVRAIRKGHLEYVPREAVDYELPSFGYYFGPMASMAPMLQASYPHRTSMGSRMTTQALPLKNAEAPLVRPLLPGSRQIHKEIGPFIGVKRAPIDGIVSEVTDSYVTIRDKAGQEYRLDYNKFLPNNRKTAFYQEPIVKVGDRVSQGDVVIKSNFSDKEGTAAFGVNARMAYLPYYGLNYEDAFVISESFAKKLTSQHAYQHVLEHEEDLIRDLHRYRAAFPDTLNAEKAKDYDPDGVIKPGAIVEKGQPLILAMRKAQPGGLKKIWKDVFIDQSVTWDHDTPAEVVFVEKNPHFTRVVVRADEPAKVGDKLSGLYGDKGVISAIIPDDQMIKDEQGRPFDILMSPAGLPSRVNISQLYEGFLGKVAQKRGQPYLIPVDFEGNMRDFVAKEMLRYGVSDKETVYDPKSGKYIPNVATGVRYILKLHHMAEPKAQGRGIGGYSMELTPSKGGDEAAKRVSLLDINAILAHGAVKNFREMQLVRGQANQDFWAKIMAGYDPPATEQSFLYDKFMNMLRAAGVNPDRRGEQIHLMALTNKDIIKLAGPRQITKPLTVDWESPELKPIPGGLFDPVRTGGHGGTLWSYFPLAEKFPSPVMETPLRTFLGVSEKYFEDIVAGKEKIPGTDLTGPDGLYEYFDKHFDIDTEIEKAKNLLRSGSPTKKNEAVRKLRYLLAAKRNDQHPRDWFWDRVPVLPPAFRPVGRMAGTDTPIIDDLNYLYNRVFEANELLKSNKEFTDDISVERDAVYRSLKELVGTIEPTGTYKKNAELKGVLRILFGKRGKLGFVQRKMLSHMVDTVGRAMITPNPDLGLDEIGIPERVAWSAYRPLVIRDMVKAGFTVSEAVDHVEKKTPRARQSLLRVMESRPIMVKRDPVLYKYGIMGFWPKLTAGNTIEVNPALTKTFGADFDGDTMLFHVPVSDEAAKEIAEKMLPSRNLISEQDWQALYQPRIDYFYGVWKAAQKPRVEVPRVFPNAKAAIDAYRKGEIGVNDPVEIIG